MFELNFDTFRDLFLRGLVGFLVWEAYTNYVSPNLLGVDLRPRQLAKNLFMTSSSYVGNILHFVVGIIIYPLLWYFLTGSFPGFANLAWPLRALALGILTWFLALGVFTPLARGPFMEDWRPLTWASLVGHSLYSLPVTF